MEFGATTLVVHAHPDDEVFATACATLAAKAAGSRVLLRVFTGGEGRSAGTSPDELAEAREAKTAKLARSARLLGIDHWDYLAEPGRWIDSPRLQQRTLAAADPDELAGSVTTCLEQLKPNTVLTVGHDGLTRHPDHLACHRAVARAVASGGHRPGIVLGAILDQNDVWSAAQEAQRTQGRTVGSGRVSGVPASEIACRIDGPADTESRRRAALDQYTPGLGSERLDTLSKAVEGAGDSVLLRFVLDHAGWTHDNYELITTRGE